MSDILGVFEQAVLVAIVRLGEQAYGRAILKEVESRLNRSVAAGAIYATLERLEDKGMASSRMGSGTEKRGGRLRRFYVVEPSGLLALDNSRLTTQNVWRGVSWPLGKRA